MNEKTGFPNYPEPPLTPLGTPLGPPPKYSIQDRISNSPKTHLTQAEPKYRIVAEKMAEEISSDYIPEEQVEMVLIIKEIVANCMSLQVQSLKERVDQLNKSIDHLR